MWVDDEDEFAEHRVQLGYPDDVIKAALAATERVRADVIAARAPFDGAADAWLARVGELADR